MVDTGVIHVSVLISSACDDGTLFDVCFCVLNGEYPGPVRAYKFLTHKVLGTFFKEFVSGYKVVFKDIGAGI